MCHQCPSVVVLVVLVPELVVLAQALVVPEVPQEQPDPAARVQAQALAQVPLLGHQ